MCNGYKHLKRRYNNENHCEKQWAMGPTHHYKSKPMENFFELGSENGSCLLFELRHAEQDSSDLFLNTRRPNLETI